MIKDKKTYHILVVEDNPGDYLLITDYLEEHISNPNIIHTQNYKETKKLIETSKQKMDVVLLDLSLPDKSGDESIENILEICEDTPVIVLTGYSDIDFSINSISKGIADYLLKDELTGDSLYKSIIYCIERLKKNNELFESEKSTYIEILEDSMSEAYRHAYNNACKSAHTYKEKAMERKLRELGYSIEPNFPKAQVITDKVNPPFPFNPEETWIISNRSILKD